MVNLQRPQKSTLWEQVNHLRKYVHITRFQKPCKKKTYFFGVHHNLQEYDHLVSEAAVFQERKRINVNYVEHLPERENEKNIGSTGQIHSKKKTANKD